MSSGAPDWKERPWIAALQQKEIERTGIASLKVRFNSVFGYYIEITKANLDKAPDDYIRKQTIANGERFVTPELKEMEHKILGAEERANALEYEIFSRFAPRRSRSQRSSRNQPRHCRARCAGGPGGIARHQVIVVRH